ncbi:MAG: hypothetical protein LBE56_02330 [Tannerella sp.]|jgi:hypothetical protein|nr:hypothetical protein [Tannerella sp.]
MPRNNILEYFRRILQSNEGELRILEQQIPIEKQVEYFNNSNRLRNKNTSIEESDIERFVIKLYDPQSSLESKKKILTTLAISKQPKAYRIIEKFSQDSEHELRDWAQLALMESRVSLESDLSDERQIFISTGLGGKGNKLRFYILLLSASGHTFLDYQRQIIEQEFSYILSQDNGEIENLNIKDNYVELLVLAPIQIDIRQIIEKFLNECNQYGDFIANSVTLTNVKILNENEIAEIIKRNENF